MKRIVLLITLFSMAVPTAPSFALPIFSENRAVKTASGVVLYPDSEDPALTYYFPGQARLVRNDSGFKRFSLAYWGLSKNADGKITVDSTDSGGMLALMAELTLTPNQRTEIEARLGSAMKVAVLPVQRSTIEMSETAPPAEFFKSLQLPSHGGSPDAYIGINASLTGIGARLLVAMLKGEEAPGFQYCYETLGLSPTFRGQVTLNWSTVYQTLKTSFSVGSFFWKKQVSVTIQKLIRDGSLRISIQAAPESEAKYEDFVMYMANLVMARMFKEAPPEMAPGGSGGGLFGPRFSLDYGRSEISENIGIHLDRSQLIKQNFCVPIGIGELSSDLSRYIHSADGISVH